MARQAVQLPDGRGRGRTGGCGSGAGRRWRGQHGQFVSVRAHRRSSERQPATTRTTTTAKSRSIAPFSLLPTQHPVRPPSAARSDVRGLTDASGSDAVASLAAPIASSSLAFRPVPRPHLVSSPPPPPSPACPYAVPRAGRSGRSPRGPLSPSRRVPSRTARARACVSSLLLPVSRVEQARSPGVDAPSAFPLPPPSLSPTACPAHSAVDPDGPQPPARRQDRGRDRSVRPLLARPARQAADTRSPPPPCPPLPLPAGSQSSSP